MIEVIPAILTDSPIKFKDLVLRLEPYANRIHIDIADGEFVPNKTLNGYDDLKLIESSVKFDIHLMVRKPQDILKEWFYTHADRFIVHVESEDVEAVLKSLRENKRKVGLALNPETSIDKIENYLDKVDFIQFMTVHPGFQGGSFVAEVVDKISAFHSAHPDIMIMCDGGITPETASRLVRAGASQIVSGSYVVKSVSVEESINKLKESCST